MSALMKAGQWAGAVGAVALMWAASSEPLVDIYLPWEWTRGTDGAQFDVPLRDHPEHRHAAEVKVAGFQKIEPGDFPEITPPEGFDMWAVLTEWSAAPEAVLKDCQMWAIGDDDVTYPLAPWALALDDLSQPCVPPGEEGPYLEWDINLDISDPNAMVLMEGNPRPEAWKKISVIVAPAGVTPQELRFGWEEPRFMTLTLPEPKPFV